MRAGCSDNRLARAGGWLGEEWTRATQHACAVNRQAASWLTTRCLVRTTRSRDPSHTATASQQDQAGWAARRERPGARRTRSLRPGFNSGQSFNSSLKSTRREPGQNVGVSSRGAGRQRKLVGARSEPGLLLASAVGFSDGETKQHEMRRQAT